MSFTNILRSSAVDIQDGVVVDVDVNASAAIALSKLATVTASKAVASNSSGILVATATTDTELGYVHGVTSAIQTQFTGKQAASAALTSLAGVTPAADNTYVAPTSITISKGLITAIS
jgi:hypothetical protein